MNEAPATLPSYVWQAPGKRVSVSLSLEVVDLLGLEVMEGFRSLPRRGLEVGGFLLGRTRRDGEGIVVEIDKFDPLECEHAVGPSYLLSATDRKALEGQVRSHRSGGALSLVGFYRSHTRKDFALTMEDADLMSDYFSKPSMVFLLIQMQRGGPPTAGFSIWEGRKGLSMTPYSPFPFRRAALTAGGYEICDRTSVPRPASQNPTEVKSKAPASPDVTRTKSAPGRLLQMQQMLGALHGPPPGTPLPAVRAMPAAPRGPQNPTGARAFSSWTEILSRFLVQARAQSRLGWLFAASILLGAVFAGALHRNAVPGESFRPAQFPPGSPPEASRVASPTTVALPETNPPAQASVAPGTETPRSGTPREERNPSSGYRAREESTSAGIAIARLRSAAVSNSPEPAVLPDPPDVASALPGAAGMSSPLSEILKPRIPQVRDPFVSVTVDLMPKSSGGGILRKLPLIGKRNKRVERADFVPPTPVREAPTVLPAELRNSIQHEVPIDVKVYIDRTGKVKFAELLSEGTGSNRDVASLAVFSARRWEFSPAHVGDETVPSEVVLRFRFGSETH